MPVMIGTLRNAANVAAQNDALVVTNPGGTVWAGAVAVEAAQRSTAIGSRTSQAPWRPGFQVPILAGLSSECKEKCNESCGGGMKCAAGYCQDDCQCKEKGCKTARGALTVFGSEVRGLLDGFP